MNMSSTFPSPRKVVHVLSFYLSRFSIRLSACHNLRHSPSGHKMLHLPFLAGAIETELDLYKSQDTESWPRQNHVST